MANNNLFFPSGYLVYILYTGQYLYYPWLLVYILPQLYLNSCFPATPKPVLYISGTGDENFQRTLLILRLIHSALSLATCIYQH